MQSAALVLFVSGGEKTDDSGENMGYEADPPNRNKFPRRTILQQLRSSAGMAIPALFLF